MTFEIGDAVVILEGAKAKGAKATREGKVVGKRGPMLEVELAGGEIRLVPPTLVERKGARR